LFSLRRKVRPSGTSRNEAVSPVTKRQDNHMYGATSARIRDGMHTECVGLEPRRERLTERLRRLGWYARRVRADCLQGGPLLSMSMHVDKVQRQCSVEHFSQAVDDVRRARLGPHGRQCGECHQIAKAPLKLLEFAGCTSRWRHGFYFLAAFCCIRSRSSLKNSSGGTKKGFCWRIPPIITIGCVRRISITTVAPNRARSYVQQTASSYFGST